MSNRSSSKQHGMHHIEGRRPKSKLRARRNKMKAVERKAGANAAWQEMLKGS